jgi:asparagine synthase (glutamine-hydrolysing)
MMEDSLNLIRSLYDKSTFTNPLDQILYVYSKSWLPDDLLIKADRMTMANSIELRVPFLDYRLVEFAFSLPENMKVRKNRRKYILYQMMKNRLPQAILQKGKLGFPVPAYKWLEKELNNISRDMLLSKQSLISHYFASPIIETLLKQSEEGNLESQHKVWLLIILEFWFNAYQGI